ncbi:hypothetical protein FJTKL_07316 [Diaporthe vaccinii]|uniref:Uncharacterized protein n=1 Tax=Diaporthe vaccinii TaxID=105482 RepID=A0ABR4EUG7_9PEZI
MSSRLDYLIRKLDELEDAIRREKREYDKARDRYDKMRSRDILEDLRGHTAGPIRGQPDNNSNRTKRPAPPRPHQRTQTLDYEVEEPDGKSYVVRGGAVFRDFDPTRDTVRRAE